MFKSSIKLNAHLPSSQMNNIALVFDISADEENDRYSTPIKTLPVKMVGRMDLSDSSVEIWRSNDVELNLSSSSALTIESLHSPRRVSFAPIRNNEGETFIVEQPPRDTDENFYEEPDSPRQVPPLQPAPILRDITILPPANYVPLTKINILNDLSEPPRRKIEETWGLNRNNEEYNATAGRRSSFKSAKLQRNLKQNITVLKEISHCSGLPAFVREGTCRDKFLVVVSHVSLAYRVSGGDVDMDTSSICKLIQFN